MPQTLPHCSTATRLTQASCAAMIALLVAAYGACNKTDAEAPAPPASAPALVMPKRDSRPHFVPGPPSGDLASGVRDAMALAEREHVRLVVYVGAPWCEPCTRFHKAVERGDLDATFPDARFLEFDRDRDGERLEQAGYGSRLIPLFAAPDADGRASSRRMEGSIKGEGAVTEITPRLLSLLSRSN